MLPAALALCAAALPALAADPVCRAQSGASTLPLVELYTSEGCDSCPPADRWVAGTFVPGGAPATAIAFHVDYWDQLGWPDRFARAEWSERQAAIVRASRGSTAYTPQVVLQGKDFAEWRDKGSERAISRAASTPARAFIEIAARDTARGVDVVASARIADAVLRGGARLVVAYSDGGHVTDVKRGENAGVTLAHEHVVRSLATSGPVGADGFLRLETTIARPAEPGKHPALVAFVERHAARDVLQSVELPLERCR